jgi:hypothetical protein
MRDRNPTMPAPSPAPAQSARRAAIDLFLISLLVLYAELIVIRWLASEIRVFAYFKNLPLMASFLGLGLGLQRGSSPRLERSFPALLAVPCVLAAFAVPMGLVHLQFPDQSVALWVSDASLPLAKAVFFTVVLLGIFFVVVAAFAALGARMSRLFERFEPLRAYSINIAGSLAGIALFSLLARVESGPVTWLALLAIMTLWFDRHWTALVSLGIMIGAVLLAPRALAWSPYYRIDAKPRVVEIDGKAIPVGYAFMVNHDYHQRALNLSKDFIAANPKVVDEPLYIAALQGYALPHVFKPDARRVLVVGAGTGNDVAASLRAGAEHVDAVEIDPTIIALGRLHHPERPYDSPKVRVVNDDARAFFKQAQGPYDLIIFGQLDSHTMFSSLSSLRLDNYVYTQESMKEALGLLSPDGMIALSFSQVSGDWISQRLYNTIAAAAGKPPLAVWHGYDSGVTFLAGGGVDRSILSRLPSETEWKGEDPTTSSVRPSTDAWPFLYIRPGARPTAYVLVLGTILLAAGLLVRRALRSTTGAEPGRFDWHLFLLGAGFMLVEVKSVAELSLLFGSTWLVNSAVFTGILVMALCANWLVTRVDIQRPAWFYGGLFASLVLPFIIPIDSLNAFSFGARAAIGAFLASLPIFFAGVVFATCFRTLKNPGAGLGANLLGAMVGGVLEYSSMLFGIPTLNLIAIALYALSLAALLAGWHGPRKPAAAPATP